jgi:hypothetical protein
MAGPVEREQKSVSFVERERERERAKQRKRAKKSRE